jgi:hypothetical protein
VHQADKAPTARRIDTMGKLNMTADSFSFFDASRFVGTIGTDEEPMAIQRNGDLFVGTIGTDEEPMAIQPNGHLFVGTIGTDEEPMAIPDLGFFDF